MFPQGSEVYRVLAKDGDAGNPNPIVYSMDDGKNLPLPAPMVR
jgi:hypothetical protein